MAIDPSIGLLGALLAAAPDPSAPPVRTSTGALAELGATEVAARRRPAPPRRADDEEETETIVVTGSRVAQSAERAAVVTTVIPRVDLERSGARNVAEALETMPGLRVLRDVTGAMQLQVRGFDTEHVLVLVDGQRVAGRKNGAVDLSRLGVERIERIEIVKGPASAAYGADALGGVINIITRRPSQGFEGDLRAGFGAAPREAPELEAETPEIAGRVAGRWGAVDGQLTASYRRRAAYDLEPATPGETGGDVEDFEGELSTGLELGDLRTRLRVEYSRRTLATVDSSPRPNGRFRIDDRDQRLQTFGVHLRPQLELAGGTLLADVSVSTYDEELLRTQRGGSDQRYETLGDTIAQLLVQYDRQMFVDHRVLVGVEGFHQTVRASRYPDFDDRSRLSAFLQDEWQLLSDLSLFGGVRVDVDTQFGTFPTPRVAARYQPIEPLVLRASWGLGFKAPLPRDLGILFDNPGAGYRVEGNFDLEPEEASTFSVSANWRPWSRITFDLEGFQSDITNLITPVPRDGEPVAGEVQVFTYGNIESARIRGVEAGVTARPISGLRIRVGYEFLDTVNLDSDLPLPGRAPHRITAGVGWYIPDLDLDLDLRSSWTAARSFSVDPEQPPLDADDFVRLDSRAQLGIAEGVQAYLGVDNLLDAGDPAFNPILPRNFYAGIQSRIR